MRHGRPFILNSFSSAEATYGRTGIYLMIVVLYIAFGLAWLSGLVAAAADWWSVQYTRAYDKMRSRMKTHLHELKKGATTTFNEINAHRSGPVSQEQQKTC